MLGAWGLGLGAHDLGFTTNTTISHHTQAHCHLPDEGLLGGIIMHMICRYYGRYLSATCPTTVPMDVKTTTPKIVHLQPRVISFIYVLA